MMHCLHETRLNDACGALPAMQPVATMPSGALRTDLVYLLADGGKARQLARTMQIGGVAAGVRTTKAGHALSVSREDLVRVGSESLLPDVMPMAVAG